MTQTQKTKIEQLARCIFLPGSWDKRFARDMETWMRVKPEAELTEKQAHALDRLYYRYRRQILGVGK